MVWCLFISLINLVNCFGLAYWEKLTLRSLVIPLKFGDTCDIWLYLVILMVLSNIFDTFLKLRSLEIFKDFISVIPKNELHLHFLKCKHTNVLISLLFLEPLICGLILVIFF